MKTLPETLLEEWQISSLFNTGSV